MVVSAEGKLRPVETAYRSGTKPSDRCTAQVARIGDLIIEINWYPEECKIYRFDGEQVDLGIEGIRKYADLILKVDEKIPGWLKPTDGKQPSYLPVGEAWDGVNTKSDLRKDSRVRQLFSGVEDDLWLKQLVADARVSTFTGIPFIWDEAGRLPTLLAAPAHRDDRKKLNMFTEWVVFFPNGKAQVIRPAPTSGGSVVVVDNVVSKHLIENTHSAPPEKLPANALRAICITRGAYDGKDGSFGVKWSLFKRT